MSSSFAKTANIHPSVKIGNNCVIGEFVSIEESCILGDHVTICDFSHIYQSSVLEDSSYVGVRCNIGSDGFGYAQNAQGESTFTPQIGNVILKKNAKVLAHSSIDRSAFKSTIIGENTVIGGHSHIAHNLEIGRDTVIQPGLVVAGSTKIGDRAKLGARTNCVGHISITSDFSCESMVLINNSVKEPGKYAGSLLRKYSEWEEIKLALLDLPNYDFEEILK